MQSQKTTILILCSFVFSPLRILSLFSRLKPLNFDHIWSFGEEFEFLELPVTLCHFIRLRWGSHNMSLNFVQKFIMKFLPFLSQIFFLMPNLDIVYDVTIAVT